MAKRILFVCLGNICRSPLAEGLFRHKATERGLAGEFEIDSAGTGAWHAGELPDKRMRRVAADRGVSLDDIRARRVELTDIFEFDHVFAMDRSNLADLRSFDVPDYVRGRIVLFRDFDPDPSHPDVPDPYYGGERGFQEVFDIVARTCDELVNRLA